jgi:hypothetical protein
MNSTSSYGGHSADVKIHLLLDGVRVPVAQLGPDFLLLVAPVEHEPAEATITLRVDSSESTWKVRLPDGISSGSRRVAIAAVE